MGVDYYAMTIMGLKVPREKIIIKKEEIVNQCKCVPQINPDNHPEIKFCPKCGNMIRKVIKVDKPLFDGFKHYWDGNQKVLGWAVEHDTDAYNFYICIYTSGHVSQEKMDPKIPNASKRTISKFKADMESVGLWDKEQFGLWTILYCSY